MADRRLGRFEVLGAWLGVWTPPRDAVVPPVPRRALSAAAVLVVAALVVMAVVVIPRVASHRAGARERAARTAAARHRTFLADVDRRQAPQLASGPRDPGPGGADRLSARTALAGVGRAGIAATARGDTDKPLHGVDCTPFPERPGAPDPARLLGHGAGAYSCVAVTARFHGGPGNSGVIGLPFRLVVHFASGRVAWCRVVPLSDRDRLAHPLPAPCRAPTGAGAPPG